MKHSGALAAVSIALGGVWMLWFAFWIAGRHPAHAAMINGFGFELFLGVVALAFASFSRMDRGTRLGLAAGRIPGGSVCVLAFGTLALSFSLDGAYRALGGDENGALLEFESLLAGARGWTIVAALMSFALAPGIAEEMLCRGLIQRGLLKRVRPGIAVGISAGVFGAMHLDPVYALLAAVLGLYLGVIAFRADSIRPSIACHAINNAVAVSAAAWELDLEVGWVGVGIGAAISLVAMAWGLRGVGRDVDASIDPSTGFITPMGDVDDLPLDAAKSAPREPDTSDGDRLQPERQSDDP